MILDERDDREEHEQRIEERRVMYHTRIMTCKAGWPSPPAMAPGGDQRQRDRQRCGLEGWDFCTGETMNDVSDGAR